MSDNTLQEIREKLEAAFRKGDSYEVIRQMNLLFGGNTYSLWHLFKDEQRGILDKLLTSTWQEIEASFRHIYEHNYAIMVMLRGMNMPLPRALSTPAEFVLNQDLSETIQAENIDLDRLGQLAENIERLLLKLDQPTLKFQAASRINRLMAELEQTLEDIELLATIERTLDILSAIVPDLDLQAAQNSFFTVAKKRHQQMSEKAKGEDQKAQKWVELFQKIAGHLGVQVP
jgi:hypothetical protein